MNMKTKTIFLLICTFACGEICHAEVADEHLREFNALEEIHLSLTRLPSLYISAIDRWRDYALTPDRSPVAGTSTYKLYYKGPRFLYDVSTVGPSGPTFNCVESYDGQYYQFLKPGGTLRRSTKPFVNDFMMSEFHFLLLPFEFIQSAFATNPFPQLSFDALIQTSNWQKAILSLREAAFTEINVDNKILYKISNIGKALDYHTKQICSFDVYFSKELHGYPIKWEKKLPNGQLVMSYEVKTLSNALLMSNISIPYPKVSTVRRYEDGVIQDESEFEIQDIKAGIISDNDLIVDPATATRIRDIDKQVYIDIPK